MNQHINNQSFLEYIIEEINERMSKPVLGSCYISINKYFGNQIYCVCVNAQYIHCSNNVESTKTYFLKRCINACIHMIHIYIHIYLYYVTFLAQDLYVYNIYKIRTSTWTHTHIYIYIYIYIYMYTYIYIYTHIYIYIHL